MKLTFFELLELLALGVSGVNLQTVGSALRLGGTMANFQESNSEALIIIV